MIEGRLEAVYLVALLRASVVGLALLSRFVRPLSDEFAEFRLGTYAKF